MNSNSTPTTTGTQEALGAPAPAASHGAVALPPQQPDAVAQKFTGPSAAPTPKAPVEQDFRV